MSEETKPTITVSGVHNLLDNGYSREDIAEHYGITMADVKRLFKHEKLKGKKAKKAPGFELVDDTVEDTDVNATAEAAGDIQAEDTVEDSSANMSEGSQEEEEKVYDSPIPRG